MGLFRYAQNLMIYVNSETILNTDRFFSLYRGELSTGIDKTIYQLPILLHTKKHMLIIPFLLQIGQLSEIRSHCPLPFLNPSLVWKSHALDHQS